MPEPFIRGPGTKAEYREQGNAIMEIRQSLGLTRKQVAERTGYKVNTLRSWEGGYAKPSAEAVAKLNEVYGLDTEPPPIAATEIPPEPAESDGIPHGDEGAESPRSVPSFAGSSRQQRLAQCYDFMGLGARLMIPHDDPRGQKIFETFHKTGPEAAKAWEARAQTSPKIAAMLDKMDAPSAGIGVMVVHFSLVVNLFLIYQEGGPQRAEIAAEPEPEPGTYDYVGAVPATVTG